MGKERLKERYRTQIDCYERALCQITGKTVARRCIYSFALREEIEI